MKDRTDFNASGMAALMLWTLVVMITGTVFGVWLKLFVLDWVLEGVVVQ